jgi:hypothetical protein
MFSANLSNDSSAKIVAAEYDQSHALRRARPFLLIETFRLSLRQAERLLHAIPKMQKGLVVEAPRKLESITKEMDQL